MVMELLFPRGSRHQLFEPKLVDVTPPPFFAWFDRPRDGVLGRTEMPDRVLPFGRIAAPDIAAFHAHAELKPGVSSKDAVVAARSTGLDVANVVDVQARHGFGLHHDDVKVRTCCTSVESIDGM
jgi:hypothetical protein